VVRVLVYTRRRVRAFYHRLAEETFKVSQIIYFSDDKYCEENYIMAGFSKKVSKEIEKHYLTDEDYINIKVRCRFLRSKSEEASRRMINTMWQTLDELIDRTQADIGFGLVIDSYVLDIYQRVLKSKGKNYYSVVPTAINNCSRITNRGEMIRIREITDQEVDATLKMITQKSYKPWYVKDGAAHIKKNLFPYYMKDNLKLLVFSVFRIIENNRYGFYYGSHFLNEPMMICNKISNCNPFIYFYYSWESRLKNSADKKLVYFPLQFYPECSTDYWNEEIYFTNYYRILFDQVKQLQGSELLLLIKEHPIALGYRDTDVYKTLLQHENVLLVPHDVPSTQLIELSDCVITGGTSTAIESYVKGKLVLTNGRIVYDDGTIFETITEEIMEKKALKEFVLNKIEKHESNDPKKLIKYLLECAIPFNFNPLVDPVEKDKELKEMGMSISNLLDNM